jgi:hypothetical protein
MSSSSTVPPSRQQIRAACAALGASITDVKYAIIGGAAVQLLGSSRLTVDVDFVVPKGSVAAARANITGAKDHFTVDPRTRHTHYKSSPPVEIEILSPPTLFQEDFDTDTPIHTVVIGDQSVSILKPVLILNAKCRSVLGRSTDEKMSNDATDIKFLLWWLATNNIQSVQEVPNASQEFVTWFIQEYEGVEYWKNAGFIP